MTFCDKLFNNINYPVGYRPKSQNMPNRSERQVDGLDLCSFQHPTIWKNVSLFWETTHVFEIIFHSLTTEFTCVCAWFSFSLTIFLLLSFAIENIVSRLLAARFKVILRMATIDIVDQSCIYDRPFASSELRFSRLLWNSLSHYQRHAVPQIIRSFTFRFPSTIEHTPERSKKKTPSLDHITYFSFPPLSPSSAPRKFN